MTTLSLAACADELGASLHGGNAPLREVSIDTRTLPAGALYVALRGPRFDGHDYVDAALAAGASAVLIEARRDLPVPVLVVDDSHRALGQLARFWATHHRVPTVAITGSNGKTTVKEIVSAILCQRGAVCATRGNLNNEIGVPLTLLSLRDEHDFAVIEMGANHAGEIARLTALAAPDVALVNNVGDAHLEGFGSREGVARAKAEIFAGLGATGMAVINTDCAFGEILLAATRHCQRVTFGTATDATVQLLDGPGLRVRLEGAVHELPFALPGRHNAMNAVAAIATATALGIGIDAIGSGLSLVTGVAGRLQERAGRCGARIIDDSYNASPASTRSAIAVLAQHTGRRVLVLGDMLELGDDARRLHAEAGAHARHAGVDALFSLGTLAAAAAESFGSDRVCQTLDSLLAALEPELTAEAVILVKGSRGSRMDRVVAALLADAPATDHREAIS